ncbi:MAG: hypothetical protein M3Y60_05035, partial [Bacteroidota bacterium]|nr:hypothetical protein [Bacteroidota bacterium]
MRNTGLALIFGILLIACSAEKKAIKAFRLGKYQTTIDIYKDQLSRNPDDGRANYLVAESYRLSNRIKEAEPYYAKARGRGIDADSVGFYYGQSLQANGNYEAARKAWEEVANRTEYENFKGRILNDIAGIDYLDELNKKESFYKVKNLELVNSPASEYSPVHLNDELYFTSSRGNGKVYEATGTPFTDIYKVSSRGAIVDLATLAPLPEGINDENINDGCITFTPDGKIMVFGKGNSGKKRGSSDV